MTAPSCPESLHDSLRQHLTHIRVTTFDQIAHHLVSPDCDWQWEKHEDWLKLPKPVRERIARRALAKVVKIGKAEGWLVEEADVLAWGDNPRAGLLFDAARHGDPTADHYAAFLTCWERMRWQEIRRVAETGRERIKVIYTPDQTPFCDHRPFAHFTAPYVTAELVLTSVYLRLTPDLQATWHSHSKGASQYVAWNSPIDGGDPIVSSPPGASYRSACVFAPVVCSDPPRPGQDKEFVDFFKWVMETRLEVTDTPLQIWLPDLDTNQS